ncbi:MAG: HAD-IB family hydrolase [Gammaproteobacteria bacterium]|nr:HAD-IB family hydrolase [Gammaproteobacteria bacterium]HJL96298.1 HAD family phosphatase [SAR86 cluster bacterium]|tara:strand:+ start:9968 stop:10618 length:651 start_codon:yes stop_codon:yes gene_type:complete
MKLALFDLDDTLLSGDTEGEWVNFMIENSIVKDNSFLEKMSVFTRNYRNGSLDIFEYSNFLLSPLDGIRTSDIRDKVEEFSNKVVNKLSDDTTYNLLKRHSSDECVITSGTLSFLVKEISNELGVRHYFGTDAEINNGLYTGKVSGYPNFSDEKVRRVKEWIGYQSFEEIYAYSDSIHDLALLEFSDFPTAVNPDTQLLEVAKKKNWEIDRSRLKS